MAGQKQRVELQFNMDNKKEKEIIEFIDRNGTTRAGFIKSVIRQYMNAIQSLGHNAVSSSDIKQEKQSTSEKGKQRKTKKKAPKLGSSFSSKDFE